MNLDKDDVVSMKENQLVSYPIAKLEDIEASIKGYMHKGVLSWLSDEGVPCEVLRTTGGGWIQGKIRIKTIIEFTPDEPIPDATDVVLGTQTEPSFL